MTGAGAADDTSDDPCKLKSRFVALSSAKRLFFSSFLLAEGVVEHRHIFDEKLFVR